MPAAPFWDLSSQFTFDFFGADDSGRGGCKLPRDSWGAVFGGRRDFSTEQLLFTYEDQVAADSQADSICRSGGVIEGRAQAIGWRW
jgi:hypothetical protein